MRYRWSSDQIPQILSQDARPSLDDAEDERPGRLSADFVYGYGRTFASSSRDAAILAHDAFDSAIRTEETEAWAQAEAYDAFGTPDLPPAPGAPGSHGSPADHQLPRAPELPRFGYRGELAQGPMIYLRARAYDSSVGRFTTRDPVTPPPGQAGTARSGNPYAYTGNDPVNFTDPTGEQFGFLGDIGHAITHVGHDITRLPTLVEHPRVLGHDIASTFDHARHDAAHLSDVAIHEIATHPLEAILAALAAAAAVILAPEAILAILAIAADVLVEVVIAMVELALEIAIETLILAALAALTRLLLRTSAPDREENPRYLYHYSDAEGIQNILVTGYIKASGPDIPNGPGVFLTDISPDRVVPGKSKSLTREQRAEGKISIYQLSRRIRALPYLWYLCTNWVKVDVRGLPVRKVVDPRVSNVYVIPGTAPLSLAGRYAGHGETGGP